MTKAVRIFMALCALAVTAVFLVAVQPAHATFPGSALGPVAFESNRDGNFEIYRMTQSGASQTRLTNNSAADEHPKWSPDGKKIAFDSTRDGNLEIYTMKADGTNTAVSPRPTSAACQLRAPVGIRAPLKKK